MTGTDLAIPIVTGTRVLVVDGNEDSVAALVAVFRLRGFNAHGVRSAKDARSALTLRSPEVLIVDPSHQHIDGCGLIRLACQLPNPPVVIAVSGMTELTRRTDAIQAGAAAYVLKPTDPDELIELIGILMPSASAV